MKFKYFLGAVFCLLIVTAIFGFVTPAMAQDGEYKKIDKAFSVDPRGNGYQIPRGSIVRQLKDGTSEVTDTNNKIILRARDIDATLLKMPGRTSRATRIFQIPDKSRIKSEANAVKIYDGNSLILTVIDDNQNVSIPGYTSILTELASNSIRNPLGYIDYFSSQWTVPSAPIITNSNASMIWNGMIDINTRIIQPVLQWNNTASGWTCAVWWVNGLNYFESTTLNANTGNIIQGDFSYSYGRWFVTIRNISAGTFVGISMDGDRTFDMNNPITLHCSYEVNDYTIDDCYIAGTVPFTNISHTYQGGQSNIQWWIPNSTCTLNLTKIAPTYNLLYNPTWCTLHTKGGLPPTVASSAATSVYTTGATLNGNLTDLGSETTVNVKFEYGTTINYGSSTTSQPRSGIGAFSFNVSDLQSNTVYHYRAKAVGNESGVVGLGNDMTFTTAGSSLTIQTTSLPGAIANSYYSASLSASGGVTPYTWGIQSGSLPAGLILYPSTGVISGTPTSSGSFNFTVQVTDSASILATKALSISVGSSPPPTLTINTTSLPNGTVGTAYSTTLAASGGTGSYSWSLYPGSLPAGLGLSTGGVISGTPTTAGTSSFTVRVTDSASTTATQPLSITVNTATPTLTITTTSLPNGTVSTAYSATLAATGGTTPYTWSLYSGSLPAGLSLSTGGVISGTPSAAATSNFTVRVTDSASPPASTNAGLSIMINSNSPTTYTINATAGANGSIIPYGSVSVNSGGSQTFNITPNSGYSITTLTVDFTPVTPASSYTFTNVTSDHSITAAFSPSAIISPTSLVFNGVHGGVNPSPQTITISQDWTAATFTQWLSTSPGSGNNSTPISVAVNMAGLNPGSYNGTILLNAGTIPFYNHCPDIPVTLNISAAIPPTPIPTSPAENATVSGTSVNFTWNPSQGATGYWLSVGRTSDGVSVFSQYVDNVTSYTVPNFPNNGTRYGWAVAAGNSSGWSAGSTPRNFTNGIAVSIPPTPVPIAPAVNATVQGTPVTFTWNASPGATGYWLSVGRTSDGVSIFSQYVRDVTSYTMHGFSDNRTIYGWAVAAGNSAGWSAGSTPRNFTNGVATPVPASPADNATVSGTSVTFTWNASPGATGYWLSVGRTSDGVSVFSQSVLNVTSYTVPNFPNNGTRYGWAVAAGNSGGWSPGSTPIYFYNGP